MRLGDFSLLLAGVLLNAGAQLALKASTYATGPIGTSVANLRVAAIALLLQPAFWGALVAYGLSVLVWVVGLSRVPVSQAYPLVSVGYIIGALLAWWLLGETLTAMRLVGIGVIVVGVVLVTRY